jgi:hypothetical protein
MSPRALPLLVLVILALCPPGTAEEKQRPRPQPETGYGRLPWQSWQDPAIAPPRPAWQYQQRIVFSFDQASRTLLTPRPDLSQLCRQNLFLQRINMHYRAFGPGEQPLGVGFGSLSANLYDPQRKRSPDTVYFFKEQDTGRCSVSSARLEDIRRYFIGP